MLHNTKHTVNTLRPLTPRRIIIVRTSLHMLNTHMQHCSLHAKRLPRAVGSSSNDEAPGKAVISRHEAGAHLEVLAVSISNTQFNSLHSNAQITQTSNAVKFTTHFCVCQHGDHMWRLLMALALMMRLRAGLSSSDTKLALEAGIPTDIPKNIYAGNSNPKH